MNWYQTPHTLMAHELTHLLGFNAGTFAASFPSFPAQGDGLLGREGGATVQFMRDHYGCQSITGIPTLYGHHFHPLFVGDDIMQPCISLHHEYRITEAVGHVLGEIGWPVVEPGGTTWNAVHRPFYDIDFSFVDPQLFGYQSGCDGYGQPAVCPDVMPVDTRCMHLCSNEDYVVPMTQEAAQLMASIQTRSGSAGRLSTWMPLAGAAFFLGLTMVSWAYGGTSFTS